MLGVPPDTPLDIRHEAKAVAYSVRSDAFDVVLDLGAAASRRGLATAMQAWMRHLLGIAFEIEPVERIDDDKWTWFIGLDAEATRIGNALWRGRELDADAAERILALFRLSFRDHREAPPQIGARPVW